MPRIPLLLIILGAIALSASLSFDAIAVEDQTADIPQSNVIGKMNLGPYAIEIVGTRTLNDSNYYEGFYGVNITNLKPKPPDKGGLGNAFSSVEYHYPEVIKIYLAYPDNKSSSSNIDVDLAQDGSFKTIDYEKTLENSKLLDAEAGLAGDVILSFIPLKPVASAGVAALGGFLGLANEASNQYPYQDVFYNEDIYDIRKIILPHQVWLKGADIADAVLIDQGCYPGYFIKFDKGFGSADVYYWIAIEDHNNMPEGTEWLTTSGKIIKATVTEGSTTGSGMTGTTKGGQITDVTWPTKDAYDHTESIPVKVNFANTGSKTRSFWVGYSVQDSTGKWWDAPPKQTATIRPGERGSLELKWKPTEDAPQGAYTAKVALWENYNSNTGLMESEIESKMKAHTFYLNFVQTPNVLQSRSLRWEKIFSNFTSDGANSVQQTDDGGYIITGGVYQHGERCDVWLIKVDSNGNETWNRTFGGFNYDEGYSVRQTTDGGYIVLAGMNGGYVYGLIKTDSDGSELWNRTLGPKAQTTSGFSGMIQQTSDGGYIITGQAKNNHVWLIKTDINGNIIWDKTYGLEENIDFGLCVQQTIDGGYVVIGATLPYDAPSYRDPDSVSALLVKTDGNGSEQWKRKFSGYYGEFVRQTNDGGYIIAGFKSSHYVKSSTYGYIDDINVSLIKTDVNGNELWNKSFGLSGDQIAYSVQQTTDGGYILAGRTGSLYNSAELLLIKIDINGNEEWKRTFGGFSSEGRSIQQTRDGGYIVAGRTPVSNTNCVWLIKTDANGNTGISN